MESLNQIYSRKFAQNSEAPNCKRMFGPPSCLRASVVSYDVSVLFCRFVMPSSFDTSERLGLVIARDFGISWVSSSFFFFLFVFFLHHNLFSNQAITV